MKILNFGSLNIDKVYNVNNFVKPGETISSKSMNIFPGGKGLNQSVAIAKSGSDVYHAGIIGRDGYFLKEILDNNKVDTSLLKIIDCETGHAIIQINDDGQNSILLFSGANYKIDEEYVSYVLDHFEADDILILQNEISCLKYIIDKAFSKGMKIALNPSPVNANLYNLDFNKIEWIILNEIEGSILSGEIEIDKIASSLLKSFKNIKIIITLGEKGSIYVDKDIKISQSIFKTNVIDTTAAGDTFLGYFISSLNNGNSIKSSLKLASMASAISVSRKGSSNSIPTKSEVMEKYNLK
ncbi:MAG: ribokinase [Filifactoraceae bacterium]